MPSPLSAIHSLLFVAVLCGVASAQQALVLETQDAAPGIYYLKVTKSADGKVAIVPLDQVLKLSGLPTNPVPPPTGPPPAPTPFEQEIERLTRAAITAGGTKTTGAALSSVYSLVADGLADGSIDSATPLTAVNVATNTLLANQPDRAAWSTWRTSVANALNTLKEEGSLSTKAQYIATFRAIASGLNRATGFSQSPQQVLANPGGLAILDGINIAQLIELIKLIIELLKAFKPA